MNLTPLPPHRIDYSPMVGRPVLRWPNDARVALWIAPNVEHYEYLPPGGAWLGRVPSPDVQQYSLRDYGNRQLQGISPSFASNSHSVQILEVTHLELRFLKENVGQRPELPSAQSQKRRRVTTGVTFWPSNMTQQLFDLQFEVVAFVQPPP